MKTSSDTGELIEALSKAQGSFKNVLATASNPFHKSKYAPLDEVLSMVRPVLAKNDLALIHAVVHNEGVAYLQTRVTHKSGQWIEDDGTPLLIRSKDKNGNEVEPTMQGFMAAETYAKRAGTMSILNLAATEEDTDGEPQSEWHGPLKKTKLAEEARKLAGAIQKAGDPDQLKGIQIEFMDVIDQLRTDLPVWYNGDPSKDAIGLKDSIVKKRQELKEESLPSETVDDDPIIGDA
jgi:hypothetical protein